MVLQWQELTSEGNLKGKGDMKVENFLIVKNCVEVELVPHPVFISTDKTGMLLPYGRDEGNRVAPGDWNCVVSVIL